MNKHLKLFANHSAYSQAESNLDKPNVAVCQQEGDIHYNPTPTTVFWKFNRAGGFVFGSFLEGDSIEMDTSGSDQAYLADNSGQVSGPRAYVNQALKDSILSAVKNTFGIEFDNVTTVFKYYSEGGIVQNWANYREITKPPLITFTVNGDEFQAEQGMTWGEFVNSSYNSGDFNIDNGAVRYHYSYLYYNPQPQVMSSVNDTDVISSSIEYWSD